MSKPIRTHPKKLAFLEAFRTAHTVQAACAAAEISKQSHHRWLEEDAEYANLYEAVKADKLETLVKEAKRRATEGDKSYKFNRNGEPLMHPITNEPYYEVQRSDRLLERMIAYLDPSFNLTSNKHDHNHRGEVNVKKVVLDNKPKPDPE